MARRIRGAVAVIVLLAATAVGLGLREAGSDGRTAPAAATGFPLMVVSHNICGGAAGRPDGPCGHRGDPDALGSRHDPRSTEGLIAQDRYVDARGRIHTGAQLFMLQEVCYRQYEALRRDFPEYRMGFSAVLTDHQGCNDGRSCAVNQDADPRNDLSGCLMGNVLAARGTLSHRQEIALGGDRWQIAETPHGVARVRSPRTFKALCYDVVLTDLPGRIITACSVHLRAYRGEINDRARTAQAATLASRLDEDVYRRKHLVVVAGDFNSRPADAALSVFYEPGLAGVPAVGAFAEADQRDPVACVFDVPCRGGAGTFEDGEKLDYIFFSATDADPRLPTNGCDSDTVRADAVAEPGSDHRLLRGVCLLRRA